MSSLRKFLNKDKTSFSILTFVPLSASTANNRPFSYSEKESQSKDDILHYVEFSNVHNSDRRSNATRSNLACKNV